jgi:hypothetical protein
MRSILLLLSQKPMSTKWTGFRYFTMGSNRIMRSILLLLSQKPMSTKWTGFRYFTMGSYRIMRSILLFTVTKAGPEMKKSTRSGLTLFVFHDGELQDHAQHFPAVITDS